ncbi:MAG: hypothetical protein V5A44_12755 [Haloarculaceae archaeon]
MYDSPSPRASHSTARSERQVRAERPPRYTPAGFAVYAALVALTPVVLTAVAAPAVAAAAVAGLVAGAVGTRAFAQATTGRPADRPVEAPTPNETA